MLRIAVAKDFNRFPGGRYPKHGPGNGQDFRERFLLPALRSGDHVVVVFDDAAGFPASFLEEAFGGLIRAGLSLQDVKRLLSIEVEERDSEIYREEAWQYIEDEAARKQESAA